MKQSMEKPMEFEVYLSKVLRKENLICGTSNSLSSNVWIFHFPKTPHKALKPAIQVFPLLSFPKLPLWEPNIPVTELGITQPTLNRHNSRFHIS